MKILELFPHIISIVAIVTSFLTTFFNILWNFKTHIKENVFERQNDLYIRFLNLLLSIKRNPYLQFEEKTLYNFEKMQSEFFIYADKECRNDFSDIQNSIKKIQTDYKNDRKNETAIDEDDIRIEADNTAVFDIQAEDEHYKDMHKIPDNQMKLKIETAISHIKKSLGISK